MLFLFDFLMVELLIYKMLCKSYIILLKYNFHYKQTNCQNIVNYHYLIIEIMIIICQLILIQFKLLCKYLQRTFDYMLQYQVVIINVL